MANPDDIEFRLKTTADVTGAETVTKSIFATTDAAKDAARQADVAAVKAKQNAAELGAAAATADPQLSKLITIQRAQVAGQISQAIGKLGDATRKMAADAKESDLELSKTLETTAVGLDSVTNSLALAAQGFALGGPFGAAVGATVGLLSGPLKAAFEDMTTSIQGAAAAEKEAAEMVEKLAIARENFAANQKFLALKETYDAENQFLKAQEETMKRQLALRDKLASTELTGARQEVDAAKLRGGDVALAETNVLVTQLRVGLDKLNGTLGLAQTQAANAEVGAAAAKAAYDNAVLNKIGPAEVEALAAKALAANQQVTSTAENLAGQTQEFEASKRVLLVGAENSLAALEKELPAKISVEAKASADGLYQNIKDTYAEGPKKVLPAVKVETAEVKAAITAKATEVTKGVTEIQTSATASSSQNLADVKKVGQEISSAAKNMTTAINSLDGSVTQLVAVSNRLLAMAEDQRREINNLAQRVTTVTSTY
jgi:hypothetical protein